MTLSKIELARTETKARLKSLREVNRKNETDLECEIAELNRQETLILNGVDVSKIQLGEHVLEIKMYEPPLKTSNANQCGFSAHSCVVIGVKFGDFSLHFNPSLQSHHSSKLGAM